jgi:hypothetical protein
MSIMSWVTLARTRCYAAHVAHTAGLFTAWPVGKRPKQGAPAAGPPRALIGGMPLVKQKGMVPLGEVIAKIYEEAEKVTPDRRRASRLAANAVARLLVRTGNVRAARKLAA